MRTLLELAWLIATFLILDAAFAAIERANPERFKR